MRFSEAKALLKQHGIDVERLCEHAVRVVVPGAQGAPVTIAAYRGARAEDGWVTINDEDVLPDDGGCGEGD